MMEDFEPRVPSYYVANCDLKDAKLDYLLQLLKMTPVAAVIVSNPKDIELARKVDDFIVRVDDIKAAHVFAQGFAKDSERPVLVLGDAEFLDGVFADGTREAVKLHG
jgi:uncharacterized protein YeeX (DUF496 family)